MDSSSSIIRTLALACVISPFPVLAMPSVELMKECAPQVPVDMLTKIVHHESRGSPWAIGLNSKYLKLASQPQSRSEAAEIIDVLEAAGLSYDVGAGQINSANLARWGVDPKAALDLCDNLKYSQTVYLDCAARYGDTAQILSCYNTNDPVKGVRNGYVSKVLGKQSKNRVEKQAEVKIKRNGVAKDKNIKQVAKEQGQPWMDNSDGWLDNSEGWMQ